MSEMMNCFVMHGIGKVGIIKKTIPRPGPIPREAWGVGMSDKSIRTALCPGGSERMSRLLESGRVDPLALTTHRFPFQDIEKAFRMMQSKVDGMIKPLISFT